MLKIGTMSTHMNANCENPEGTGVCTFEANAYGEVVNNISINGMTIYQLAENLDVIKADFMAFLDAVAEKVAVVKEEVASATTTIEPESEAVQEEMFEDTNSDGIIDSLFVQQDISEVDEVEPTKSEHSVDPDDFALYKKYLS